MYGAEELMEQINFLTEENDDLKEQISVLEDHLIDYRLSLTNLSELVDKKNLEIKELQETILTIMVNENQENGLY